MEKQPEVTIPRIHRATDRRCYNGAYCSDMEREIGSIKRVRSVLAEVGISITYFPAGDFYVGFENNKIVTGDCASFESCVAECAEYLRGKGLTVKENQ